MFGRRGLSRARGERRRDVRADGADRGGAAAALRVYLAAVPAYGARPGAALRVPAARSTPACSRSPIARRQPLLHARRRARHAAGDGGLAGDVATARARGMLALAFTAAFVAALPGSRRRSRGGSARPLSDGAERSVYAAPLLLFVFPVLARDRAGVRATRCRCSVRCSRSCSLLIAWRAIAIGATAACTSSPRSSPSRRRRSGRRRT